MTHPTTGRFDTPNGAKYLQQLCKHFAHKREVRFGDGTGMIAFDFGTAYLSDDATGLEVRIELNEADQIPHARSVIDKHLARFAFREDFSEMSWV